MTTILALRRWLRANQDTVTLGLAVAFTLGMILAVYTHSGSGPTVSRTVASGLYQGMLYFMVAAGLSIVFGLMDVLNFAQGALFMLGAYVGFDVLTTLPAEASTDSRLLTIYIMVNAPLVVVVLEMTVRRILRRGGLNLPKETLGTLGHKIGLAALLGVPLGYFLGGAISSDASGNLARIIGALVVLNLVLVDASREAMLYTFRWVSHTITTRLQQAWEQIKPGSYGHISPETRAEIIRTSHPALPPFRMPALPGGAELIFLGVVNGLMILVALGMGITSPTVIRLGLAAVAAVLAGAIAGIIMERFFIRPTYSRPFFQIVLTFGLALVIREAIIERYGRESLGTLRQFLPASLTGVIEGTTILRYWVFLIIMGLIMMISVQILLQRTRIGIIIRAGVQDSEMVEALGINVRAVFTGVFALGAGIAALGGIISGGFLSLDPGLGDFFLLQAIAVVIIGGLGSYAGTAIASIMIGISRQVAGYYSREYYNTDGLAPIVVLALLCLILIVKPSGLFGKGH